MHTSSKNGNYKRFSLAGPGGMDCPCCGGRSGNKYARRARQVLNRQQRQRELRDIARMVRSMFNG